MANEEATPRPFDVRTIRTLVRFMSRHDLSEIDLHEGEHRIRIRRGHPGGAVTTVLAAPAHHAPAATAPAAPAKPAEPEKPKKNLVAVKSPTIGVFYRSREQGGKPLADVGTRVTPTTVVGLVEAMKLFTDIPADCTGVIAEVVAQNAEPVE